MNQQQYYSRSDAIFTSTLSIATIATPSRGLHVKLSAYRIEIDELVAAAWPKFWMQVWSVEDVINCKLEEGSGSR